MKNLPLLLFAVLLLAGCSKTSELTAPEGFRHFIIPKGKHYSNLSGIKKIETGEMSFIVRFDSSAIYESVLPENQYDINKLYGFSDNDGNHHQYSARFGWRWSDGALRLFAYVYNEGKVDSREITAVPLNTEISCSIRTTATNYVFTAGDHIEIMPRKALTPVAKGYQLYPYFGGDEPAPHDISIYIKDLP